MKNKRQLITLSFSAALCAALVSCYNADKDFPDYEGGTTAYFAYQNPVRTLVLGNDIYDNTLDNAHRCRIWATMGGAYNGRQATVDIAVDPTLCDGLWFTDDGGNPAQQVLPLPTDYYTLSAPSISYGGDLRGYVEVQFTDAFFNDPKTVENTYVIPLVMTGVKGIDHILTGKPREGLTPARTNTEDWEVLAKDYVLYCVKYMNPWQGKYVRRGKDQVTENDVTTTVIRKDTTLVNTDLEHYKENPINQNDEVCAIVTKNMTQAIFPVSIRRTGGQASISCNLILTFSGNNCTITTDDADVEVTGTGQFIEKGTEKAEYKDFQWGSMNGKPVDRDILRLDYNITFKGGKVIGHDEQTGQDVTLASDIRVATADTLVVQTRESNKKEFFSNKYVKP